MVNDVIAGQSTHAIGPQVAQSISNGAQQAVTDLASGNAQAAANDLQGVATSIANGLANGYITPAYATTCRPISNPRQRARSRSGGHTVILDHDHDDHDAGDSQWQRQRQWSGKWLRRLEEGTRIARSCSDDVTRPNSKRMQHEHVEARLNLDAPFTKTDCQESIDCAERDPESQWRFEYCSGMIVFLHGVPETSALWDGCARSSTKRPSRSHSPDLVASARGFWRHQGRLRRLAHHRTREVRRSRRPRRPRLGALLTYRIATTRGTYSDPGPPTSPTVSTPTSSGTNTRAPGRPR